MNLKKLFRRIRDIAAWPYSEPFPRYQREREVYFRRMMQANRPGHVNLCALAIYYINTREECEESLRLPRPHIEDLAIDQYRRDLTARLETLERVTNPDQPQVVIPITTLKQWQWDDDLRMSIGLPNEQYDEAYKCVAALYRELSNLPA